MWHKSVQMDLPKLDRTQSLPETHNTKPCVNFLIVGAQKAGTTALSTFLSAHSDLFLPKVEAHYFDVDTLDWEAPDYEVYERKFRAALPHQLIGAKIPIYMFWDNSMERIHAYNPDIKLIAVLRHPAHRAYSNWKMEAIKGLETMSFSDAIRTGRARSLVNEDEKQLNKRRFSFVERGFYAPQIERMLKYFGRDQILFLTNDQMKTNQPGCLDQVCLFLDVDKFETYPPNATIQPKLNLFQPSQINLLPASVEDMAYLNRVYADDIVVTAALTGLDLNHWLPN